MLRNITSIWSSIAFKTCRVSASEIVCCETQRFGAKIAHCFACFFLFFLSYQLSSLLFFLSLSHLQLLLTAIAQKCVKARVLVVVAFSLTNTQTPPRCNIWLARRWGNSQCERPCMTQLHVSDLETQTQFYSRTKSPI